MSGTFHSKAEYIEKVYRPLDEHLETWPAQRSCAFWPMRTGPSSSSTGSVGWGKNGTDYSLRYCWVIHVENSVITEVIGHYDQTKVAELFA